MTVETSTRRAGAGKWVADPEIVRQALLLVPTTMVALESHSARLDEFSPGPSLSLYISNHSYLYVKIGLKGNQLCLIILLSIVQKS